MGTVEGKALDSSQIFNFEELIEGVDFVVDYNSGIISINRSIGRLYTIGVTYKHRDGTVVGNYQSIPRIVKLLRKSNQSYDDPDTLNYWKYQVRNVYNLNMQNIKSDGFSINVYNLDPANNTVNYYVPDSIDTGGAEGMTFNEYLNLDSNHNGTVNGDDAAIDLFNGYIIFPFIRPFEPLGDVAIYQKVHENILYDDYHMFMSVKGQIGRETISLGQMNLLPGSVVVKLGEGGAARTLKENIDYTVDYDFGVITLLNKEAKAPSAKLNISYQFRPLFAVESKSLMGLRADLDINENLGFGGTFLYQSERVTEERPKIGNENRSIFLADIDGKFKLKAPFITKAVDWLPLIKTDEESNISINGEIALSFPKIFGNPKQKDKKEAYIDDMESIMDSYPLGVIRTNWVPASKPFGTNFGKADINWYNPDNIFARDVYDPSSLTEKEEREKVSVLTCRIDPPSIGNPGFENKYWAGIMRYIGNQINFSKKKYIEFLVKVDEEGSDDVTMHIDLGMVSEDFYKPGESETPDMEDGCTGKVIDGIFDADEDLGLDGIADGEPGDDPFDNFDIEKNSEGDYPHINGTEGNHILDSEDLDEDGVLNTSEVFFEYSASLSDTSGSYLVSEYNGWRLYRIPLKGSDNYRIVSNTAQQPDLAKINYARVWFEVEDMARIRIVNLDLVGNKWEEGLVKEVETDSIISEYQLELNGESMLVGTVNNQKDIHYTPAPGTMIKKNGEVTMEQSLVLNYSNLQPGHYGLVTQQVRDPNDSYKGLNLLSYGRIRFWVYPEKLPNFDGGSDLEHDLIIRLGADSLIYYEIVISQNTLDYQTKMEENNWQSIDIDFNALTFLKTHLNISDSINVEGNYRWYWKDYGKIKIGMMNNPTLSNIKEISLGVAAKDEEFNGAIYFDDIRVADPYEDVGIAARTSFSASFADFSTLNVSLEWKTPNFQNSTTRKRTSQISSYAKTTTFSITNKYFLHKLFPAEWGLNFPVTLARSQSSSIPLFKSASDIRRSNLSKKDKEREKSKSLSYQLSTGFSMNKTPRSKILAYTIKKTSLSNVSIRRDENLTPVSADTTLSVGGTYSYNLDLPKEKLGFHILKNYKFYFFPSSINNSLTYSATYPRKWDWKITSTDSIPPHWEREPGSVESRTISTNSFIKYDLFSDISTSYKLDTSRDLTLKSDWENIPVGQEKNRTQTISLDYTPSYLKKVFSYNINTDIVYKDRHQEVGQSEEDKTNFLYSGSVGRDISGAFTLKNKDMMTSFFNWLKARSERKEREKTEENNSQEKQATEEEKVEEKNIEESEENKVETENENEQKSSNNENEEINITESDSTVSEEIQPPKKKKHIFRGIFSYLGRLENITVNYSNHFGSDYEKREKRPEFLYQLGAPHILKNEELRKKDNNDSYSISSGFPILNNLTTDFSYSKDIKRQLAAVNKKTTTTIFPNINITLSEFEKMIKIEKVLTSSRLSSGFSVSKKQIEDLSKNKLQSEEVKINLQPLLSWTGNWIHNISSTINVSYSNSETTTFYEGYNKKNISESSSVSGNFKWSFSSPTGIKLPFLKRRLRIKNEMSAHLNFNLDKDLVISDGNEGKVLQKNSRHFVLSPGIDYNFSKNITGGLNSNYDYQYEKKRDFKISTLNFSLWGEIKF